MRPGVVCMRGWYPGSRGGGWNKTVHPIVCATPGSRREPLVVYPYIDFTSLPSKPLDDWIPALSLPACQRIRPLSTPFNLPWGKSGKPHPATTDMLRYCAICYLIVSHGIGRRFGGPRDPPLVILSPSLCSFSFDGDWLLLSSSKSDPDGAVQEEGGRRHSDREKERESGGTRLGKSVHQGHPPAPIYPMHQGRTKVVRSRPQPGCRTVVKCRLRTATAVYFMISMRPRLGRPPSPACYANYVGRWSGPTWYGMQAMRDILPDFTVYLSALYRPAC